MAVTTVAGSVDAAELGATLCHEHLLIDLGALWEPPPPSRAFLADAEPTIELLGELARDPYVSRPNLLLDDAALAVRELESFRALGGRTVVDLTTVGLRPRPEILREIARRSDLHIVAGCGYYSERCLASAIAERCLEALRDELFAWMTEGMYGSSVRAGTLGELGTSSPITAFEERQLRAAARVQRALGPSIHVHPQIWGHEHLRILDILDDEGADLSRVVICHCDELVEPEWHARIAERGAVLAFDTFGSEDYFDHELSHEPRDVERIACLVRLLEKGYAKQVVLSQDVCTKMQLKRYGGWGYDHILAHIVPRLRQAGVSTSELDQMLIATPRRLLDLPRR